jgi:hypothetical protein
MSTTTTKTNRIRVYVYGEQTSMRGRVHSVVPDDDECEDTITGGDADTFYTGTREEILAHAIEICRIYGQNQGHNSYWFRTASAVLERLA